MEWFDADMGTHFMRRELMWQNIEIGRFERLTNQATTNKTFVGLAELLQCGRPGDNLKGDLILKTLQEVK